MTTQSMAEQSDDQLMTLLRKGDAVAFKTLYNRYWESLYIAANKVLNNPGASEDIVQEVFLDLWQRAGKTQIHTVKAYLYQAVRFQVAKNIRKTHFSEYHLEILDSIAWDNSVIEQIQAQDLDQTIKTSLKTLPQRCQQIFFMSRFEHLSNQEIAARLNISIRTVETQISKALKHLKVSVALMLYLLIF